MNDYWIGFICGMVVMLWWSVAIALLTKEKDDNRG